MLRLLRHRWPPALPDRPCKPAGLGVWRAATTQSHSPPALPLLPCPARPPPPAAAAAPAARARSAPRPCRACGCLRPALLLRQLLRAVQKSQASGALGGPAVLGAVGGAGRCAALPFCECCSRSNSPRCRSGLGVRLGEKEKPPPCCAVRASRWRMGGGEPARFGMHGVDQHRYSKREAPGSCTHRML